MALLVPDTLDFIRELELNNNREWFEANKKRYEKSVKAPMTALAGELIEQMKAIDPAISMQPKEALFRINRDTRFSKDKSPYKTNAALAISSAGKQDHSRPGLYFNVEASKVGIATGCYMLEPDQLKAMRSYLAAHDDELRKHLADPEFKKHFGEIRGEKNKVLPPEFKEAAAKQPLIFNKQFYYWADYDAEEALREDLVPFIMSHMRAAVPMNQFLMKALS